MLTITNDGLMLYEDADLRKRISEARNAVEPNPSDAQKSYGNYRKGHVTIQGLPITIEYVRGGTRCGKDKDGNVWSVTMAHDYGYIKRTESEADGDHVDVFVGPHPESEIVFVVDQVKESGRFDEHKALIGFTNEKEARQGYLDNYAANWNGLGAIKSMRMPEFKKWIYGDGTGKRISGQYFSYMVDSVDRDGHYGDISDLIIQRSIAEIAEATKDGDERRLARATKRWSDETKRRLMLKHMLIDYEGHYEERWVTIGGHAEGNEKHVGGTVIKIDSKGTIEGGGTPALKGTNVSNAKETLDKAKDGPKESAKASPATPEPASQVAITPNGKFTPDSERQKSRAERREVRRKAGGGKTEKYDPKKDRTGSTLYKIISRMGGISRASADKYGIRDLMESGLSGILPKDGGRDIEEIATALHKEGHIAIPGWTYDEADSSGGAHQQISAESKRTGADAGEYLLDLVKAKSKSLHEEMAREFERMQKAYFEELENARKAGIDQSAIDEAVRSGQADGVLEEQKGEAWEGDSGVEQESPTFDANGQMIPF